MCGIVAVVGTPAAERLAAAMTARLHHRGPDAHGAWTDRSAQVALGHTRLSIIDLSDAGRQPMTSADGRYTLVFNGEVYNHVELRAELGDYPFRSHTDSEVVLAAWARWGERSLERMIGMFAFVIWDDRERQLVAVRDRFGVKPLVYAALPGGGLALASEIKALHAAGVPAEPDAVTWASYLTTGITDHATRSFWNGVEVVPAGCLLAWRPEQAPAVRRWYDLAARVGPELDARDEDVVKDEYLALLRDSVRLRFRSDVPVGINLSGGLDSSVLLGLVHAVQGADSDVAVYTFVTGDDRYDELPWVQMMLERTHHRLIACALAADEVPALAEQISAAVDEPYGGIPTLAYAKLFRRARQDGVLVLLDGQGIDEQWAGYDYFRTAVAGSPAPIAQGGTSPALRPDCLAPDFAARATASPPVHAFPDRLRNLQLRDLTQTKLPRALRYNDRVSMAASTELREPFLDHRLVELAMRQREDRKIVGDTGKRLMRDLAQVLLPGAVRLAPKRPVQTPQREWLRGPLRDWADAHIARALHARPGWFDAPAVEHAWRDYLAGNGDNSYWVWQWISAGMVLA